MTTHPVAQQFVQARLEARCLADFPGTLPASLEEAYAYQAQAIDLWPDTVAGWKIGRIQPPWLERLGESRLVGPIFRRGIRAIVAGEPTDFPVFPGGFAAVEAEFIFRLAADPPADRLRWTIPEASSLDSALHIGVECAGSPLASINDQGPLAIVSDFGNNAGLLLGPEVADWRARGFAALTTATFVDGTSVGRGGAASLPGGPLAGLAFALECCARLGRQLRKGDLVSSGATTGVHEIRAGQSARVRFDGCGELLCRAVPARPLGSGPVSGKGQH